LLLDPAITSIDEFRYEHITIEGYDHHPHISAPISI
jgi:thymidylate synthase